MNFVCCDATMIKFPSFLCVFLLVSWCHSKKKDSSGNSVTDFLEKEAQKLKAAGNSCSLKKVTDKTLENLRLTQQDDGSILCLVQALQDPDRQTNGHWWSVLGSFFRTRGLKSQTTTCFKLATKLTGKLTDFIKNWFYIGPFVIGKMELDGDPIEAFGGIRNVSKYRHAKGSVFYSELVPEGEVKWLTVKQVSADSMVKFSPKVNWNDLVNSIGSMGITEWQGWFVGEFALNAEDQNVLIQCLGVNTLYIDDIPLTGDVYHRSMHWFSVDLEPGVHSLYIRLRTKIAANFKCTLRLAPVSFEILPPSYLPDLLDGYLFSSHISVPVSNYHHSKFLKITRVSLTGQSEGAKLEASLIDGEGAVYIAPGQILPLTVKLQVKDQDSHQVLDGCKSSDTDIHLKFSTSEGPKTISLSLRCRRGKESFLFTFVDHDGSVQHGAAVAPIHGCSSGICPVTLTLHGTTVPPQNQADSYKKMEDGKFVFGVEKCWLLAPTRHGAHNWEGPGILTALSALSNLVILTQQATWLKYKADGNRVIYAGHSMGGHGAWHLATHYPDRALALLSLAGWIKKEEYGDSNLFFKHDIATSFADPAVKAVTEACIAENDADRHVTNLKGIPVLTRIGANDRTVHPFFMRRMYRLLREDRVDVNYTELEEKEHWWWDTRETNDGGVVNDKQLRDFTNKHANAAEMSTQTCDGEDCGEMETDRYSAHKEWQFKLTCYNPALGEGLHGIQILQQRTPFRLSEIEGEVSGETIKLTTINVKRFSLSEPANRKIGWKRKSVQVDGSLTLQQSDVESLLGEAGRHICMEKGKWKVCDSSVYSINERGPENLGPARRIAEKPFLIVVGSQGSAEITKYLLQSAVYIANLFYLTDDARAPVVMDSDLDSSNTENINLILLGGPQENLLTSQYLQKIPLKSSEEVGITLETCNFKGSRTGFMSLAPNGQRHLTMILMGNSKKSFSDVVTLAAPTIPPMTRSPFSNLLPDFVITGPEFGRKGPGGFSCAGFWGNKWEFRADLTSCVCTD